MAKWIDEDKDLYSQLKDILEKDLEAENKKDSGKTTKQILDFYQKQFHKLSAVPVIMMQDSPFRTRYVQFIQYLNSVTRETFSESRIDVALTVASCFSLLKMDLIHFQDEELALIGGILAVESTKNIRQYGTVIAHPAIVKSMMKKADNMADQVEIGWEIIEYCDSIDEDTIATSKNRSAIEDSLLIIEEHELREELARETERQK